MFPLKRNDDPRLSVFSTEFVVKIEHYKYSAQYSEYQAEVLYCKGRSLSKNGKEP